jgi:hypothetical protein
MKLKLRNLFLVTTVAVVAALSGALIENVQAYQAHMHDALDSLRNARHQLEIAEHDKGGHRDNAIGLIDQAIAEVKAGIDAGQ